LGRWRVVEKFLLCASSFSSFIAFIKYYYGEEIKDGSPAINVSEMEDSDMFTTFLFSESEVINHTADLVVYGGTM
jgi:hypothetical protein